MSDRDLTTTRQQVFGDVTPGTKCRICGRPVNDGRSKTCSDYCDNIQTAVMGMLNWSSVRRTVLERDEHTCQCCGFEYELERKARDHIRHIIDERAGERPEAPAMSELAEMDDDEFDPDDHYKRVRQWRSRRDELKDRYGDPYEHEVGLEVDHITPISEGGHPFDPGNLQTLCEDCHQEKTAAEASERAETPTRSELNESLFAFVSGESE